MVRGVSIQRLAFDILQGQKRTTGGVDARVVETSDARMLQRRQDVTLAIEPLREPVIEPGDPRQLERHLTAQRAISSLCQPYRRCPSGAELANQPIRSDPVTTGECGEAATQ